MEQERILHQKRLKHILSRAARRFLPQTSMLKILQNGHDFCTFFLLYPVREKL